MITFNSKKRRGLPIMAENVAQECKLIEDVIAQALLGKESVEITRQPYFEPREGGVPHETDIRTDKMEVFRNAISASTQKYYEDRTNRNKGGAEETPKEPEKGAEAE